MSIVSTIPISVTSVELPLERPSLATTYLQLFSQGNNILQSIIQIISIILIEEGITMIIEGLLRFLDKVGDYIQDTLSLHGPNDSVAY
jgi:hypothetical protein